MIIAISSLTLSSCQSDQSKPQVSAAASSTRPDDDPNWQAGSDKPPSANTYFRMAKILVAQGRDGQAQIILQKILSQYPQFTPAYVELAQLHLRQRQADMAIMVLVDGLKVSPNDPVLMNNIGVCYMLKGDYDKALSSYEKACAANPDDARSRSNLAMILGMKGRYNEALALYEQILPPGEAHYNVALLAQARQDEKFAKAQLDKAKQLGYSGPPSKKLDLKASASK